MLPNISSETSPKTLTDLLHGLYAITDTPLMGGRLLSSVEDALKAGVTLVQYRDKTTDEHRREVEASALQALCSQYGAILLINDDIALAAKVGTKAVHIGQTDGNVAEARTLLGDDAIIGVTCHDSLELAKQAADEGADYVAFGAFFPSSTKPNAIPAPLALLSQAKEELDIPVVAIGGITLNNATDLIEAGADMLAVVSALFAVDDITCRAQEFADLFIATEA